MSRVEAHIVKKRRMSRERRTFIVARCLRSRSDTFEGLSVGVRRVATSERDRAARRERVRFRKVIILERNWEMGMFRIEKSLSHRAIWG